MKDAVVFKGVRNGLELHIDGDRSFHDVEENLHQKLEASSSFFNAGLEVTIICESRPLSYIEVADFEEILKQYGLVLKAVLQEPPKPFAYQSVRKALEQEATQMEKEAIETLPEIELNSALEPEEKEAEEEMPYLFESEPAVDQMHEEVHCEDSEEVSTKNSSDRNLSDETKEESSNFLFETDPALLASGKIEGGALVFRRTLRNGQIISYPGVVVVIGDVNPGAEIISGEDIFIHGACRGVVHAGIPHQREATITANKLMATQIRIADVIARSPDKREVPDYPEKAIIKDGKILIEKM